MEVGAAVRLAMTSGALKFTKSQAKDLEPVELCPHEVLRFAQDDAALHDTQPPWGGHSCFGRLTVTAMFKQQPLHKRHRPPASFPQP